MNVNLIITKTSGHKKTIPLTQPITTLGRGPECDLRIPIDSCSREHCQFILQGNALHIKDLGSSNGTFVNNQRIEESALSSGDRVTIGPVVITIQIDENPADSPNQSSETGQFDDELIPSQPDGDAGSIPLASGGSELAEDPLSALEALADTQEDEE